MYTDEMRYNRYSSGINSNGNYIPGTISNHPINMPEEAKPYEEDTINRRRVIREIEARVKNGENLESVVEEIAGRKEIQEQFAYFFKNNIDIKNIFKNLYISYIKNHERNDKCNER